MYDYIVVGAGLYGAVFAREAFERGKKYWFLKEGIILQEIFTRKKLKE